MMRNRITRRAITIPAVLIAAALAVALFPLAIVIASVLDVATKPSDQSHRHKRSRITVFLTGYLLCEVFAIVSALVLWIACGFGVAVRSDWGQRIHATVQSVWVRMVFALMVRVLGFRLTLSGEDNLTPGPIIVLSRHTSMADTVLPALALVTSGLRLRYVMKRELLVVPALDLFGHRLPNHFADRSGDQTSTELAAIERLACDLSAIDAAVIFPEGTRFTEEKRRRAVAKASERDPEKAARYEGLRYVLPPRNGGTDALLRGCPNADVVLFLHSGLEGLSSLAGVLSSVPFTEPVVVEIQRIERSEVHDNWLLEAWERVDEWVAQRQVSSNTQVPLDHHRAIPPTIQ